jgi:uncharacterized membrane protein YjgN (DUF898 family)
MNQFSWGPIGAPPPPPVPPPLPVSFTGNRKEFFQLVARGAGLELVTLGFYRFWLVTDIRRHLWSNTVIDGDAAEYTGRGKELLIGFLVALAILVPIYLGYFLITIEAERWQGFASLPLVASFYVFGQFAIYRARRYRLTRTVWRGVRFWMDGSGWAYAARATLWGLFAIVTLGIALPWRQAALERYKVRHSWYGDLQGKFEGQGWAFFKKIWWLWLVTPIAIIFFPLAPFLYAYYKAVEWRWWLSGIRFGGVSLESTLAADALLDLYWKVIGWSMLLSTVFGAIIGTAGVLVAKTGAAVSGPAGPDALLQSIPLMVVTVVGYLALALAFSVVTRLYLSRDLWLRVLASLHVSGLEAAANVSARGDLASALGEGIADGLDVAGF